MQKNWNSFLFLERRQIQQLQYRTAGRMVWQRKNQGGMADKKRRAKANKKAAEAALRNISSRCPGFCLVRGIGLINVKAGFIAIVAVRIAVHVG